MRTFQLKKKTKLKTKVSICLLSLRSSKVLLGKKLKLLPLGKISLTKPASLRKLLNIYSQIVKKSKDYFKQKCEKCALCRNHGKT